jgi:hypothetical protein
MFDKQIIDGILEAWLADQSHPHRGRAERPLPDPRDVKAILETVFMASIKREEEKPVTVAITLLPKTSQEETEGRGGNKLIVPFDESLPFTTEAIKKIAFAFHPEQSSLTVSPKEKFKSEYEIWGVAFFNKPKNIFSDIPVGVGLTFFRPDALTITAISPGSLIISRGDSVIGTFFSGEFRKATPTPFVSKAMGHYALDLIRKDSKFEKFGNGYWYYYCDTLQYLLSECSKRSRGGTIVIIPVERISEYEKNIIPKYRFRNHFGFEEILNRLLQESERKGEHFGIQELITLELSNKFLERIESLAQLSCIDGALILTGQLNVLSFGSTLKSTKWNGKVFIGPDGFGGGGENVDVSKLGNRHNSTIDFIGISPGSIAFVISQDGPIRGLVRKDEETILYWPDCFVSMFLEEAIKSKN